MGSLIFDIQNKIPSDLLYPRPHHTFYAPPTMGQGARVDLVNNYQA